LFVHAASTDYEREAGIVPAIGIMLMVVLGGITLIPFTVMLCQRGPKLKWIYRAGIPLLAAMGVAGFFVREIMLASPRI